FFFQAEDGIRDPLVTGVQTCALPILALPLVRGDVHLVAQGERDIVETFEQAGAREVVDLERWANARRLDDATLDVDGDLGRRIGAHQGNEPADGGLVYLYGHEPVLERVVPEDIREAGCD